MRKLLYFPVVLWWLFTLEPSALSAQTGTPEPIVDAIWPQLENRLDQPDADSTLSTALAQVRDRCDGEYDCLYRCYYDLTYRLERRFLLLPAIRVCEEIVKMAHGRNDAEVEAGACLNLNRYYGAIGYKQSAAINLDRALQIYVQTGNQPAVLHARMTRLEQSLDYRKLEDVLPEMEALLAGAVAKRDTQSATYLHLRLLLHCQTLGRYDEMAGHIEALEKVPLSDPIRPSEYGIAIHAALGRADLARVRQNLLEAERYYQKTLHLCEAEPSRWLEIRVLQSLAELAREQHRTVSAKNYLDKAEAKAERLELHDLLAGIYGLKSEIAEAEGRYADALRYTREKTVHEQKFAEKSAGFDVRNHHLQLEKDRLAAEKENSELELALKKSQLRYSLAILLLSFLLIAGFVYAYLYQRHQKKILAGQNVLIQEQAEALLSLDRLKSRFFANMSHELRTPLTLILGAISETATDAGLSPKGQVLLDTAQRNGGQLLTLINEILDLSKLEATMPELEEQPTVLRDFLEETVRSFQPMAESRQLRLELEYAAEPGWTLALDRPKLLKIINNLLSNALRFTPPGGRIRVAAAREENDLVLQVQDTGSGIHPDDLPHVFELYYQSKRPGVKLEGGTGIGLALSRELTLALGGRLWAESHLGEGSTFFLRLPAKERHAAEAEPIGWGGRYTGEWNRSATPPVPRAVLPAAEITAELLVVEDNPDLQEFLRTILPSDYRLTLADNGRAALDYLESAGTLPDLLLSDVMMPLMDGFELLEALRADERWRTIPVIFLTALADRDHRMRAFRAGIDDYIVKPFSPEELLVRIDNALRNLAARREWIGHEQPSLVEEPGSAGSWLEQLEEMVRQNLGNPQFNIDDLAERMQLNRTALYRRVREQTGLSANQFVQEIRLLQARDLLESGACKALRQVADAVGFRSPDYLSRLYRARFGKSPAEYL